MAPSNVTTGSEGPSRSMWIFALPFRPKGCLETSTSAHADAERSMRESCRPSGPAPPANPVPPASRLASAWMTSGSLPTMTRRRLTKAAAPLLPFPFFSGRR